MLIQFSVKNYKTFKDLNTLSLVASNYDKTNIDENTFYNKRFKYRLLKSAVIYGANASGKSNFFDAYYTFRKIIFNSSKESQADEKLDVIPFLLDTKSESEATSFEIIFILTDSQYRYGFEAKKEKILREWLFVKNDLKERQIFYRTNQKFDNSGVIEMANELINKKMIRENALFLSVLAQFNDKTSKNIFKELRNINSISGINQEGYEGYTIHQIESQKSVKKEDIIKFLNVADFGIEELKVSQLDINNLPDDMPESLKDVIRKSTNEKNKVNFYEDVTAFRKKNSHQNQSNELVPFSMNEDESSGTRKYFALSGPILDTLKCGATLFVDELDSQLHPLLTRNLIKLFNSKESNPKNAQLIFNTHDVNLLNVNTFRRDQIWFTEKNNLGCASLYSLADIKLDDERKIRNDENYEKNYLQGKYGGVPYINSIDFVQ